MTKSTKAQSPAAYADVKQVMALALKKPGLKYVCSSYGKAINFKLRCNRYRNMLREMQQEQIEHVPGARAETAFDILRIVQRDEQGKPDRKGRVLIFEHETPQGMLFDPETGEPIELEGITDVIRDD